MKVARALSCKAMPKGLQKSWLLLGGEEKRLPCPHGEQELSSLCHCFFSFPWLRRVGFCISRVACAAGLRLKKPSCLQRHDSGSADTRSSKESNFYIWDTVGRRKKGYSYVPRRQRNTKIEIVAWYKVRRSHLLSQKASLFAEAKRIALKKGSPYSILSLVLYSAQHRPMKLCIHLHLCWSIYDKRGFCKHRATAGVLVAAISCQLHSCSL